MKKAYPKLTPQDGKLAEAYALNYCSSSGFCTLSGPVIVWQTKHSKKARGRKLGVPKHWHSRTLYKLFFLRLFHGVFLRNVPKAYQSECLIKLFEYYGWKVPNKRLLNEYLRILLLS